MSKPRDFQNNHYYHICNRGVDKRLVFIDERDYVRFLISMREFNREKPIESLYRLNQLRRQKTFQVYDLENRRPGRSPLVEFVAYCLNPNHYHFLLRQIGESGISDFMSKLGNGYTKYFNNRYDRSGSLFQGAFKSVEIKTDAQLYYISAYINANAQIHQLANAHSWPWSSFLDYLGLRNGSMCNKFLILKEFSSIKNYEEYTAEVIKYASSRKEAIKKYYLE